MLGLPLDLNGVFSAGSLSQRSCHYVNILIFIVLLCKDSKSIGTLRSDIKLRTLPPFQAEFGLYKISL